MDKPKLRDGNKSTTTELFPLNEIPFDIVKDICGHIVYLTSVGRKDISGDDFGDALSNAVKGIHFASPVGIADVAYEKMCWSAKTVKNAHPFTTKSVRLISGRNSPTFSFDIEDPFADIQKTGEAVLRIWNERVKIAAESYTTVRTMTLIRNEALTQFCLFEEATHQYSPSDYEWKKNNNGNLLGIDKKTGKTAFTWQPHGSQFTIHVDLPATVIRFDLKKAKSMDEKQYLISIDFNDDWIHVLK